MYFQRFGLNLMTKKHTTQKSVTGMKFFCFKSTYFQHKQAYLSFSCPFFITNQASCWCWDTKILVCNKIWYDIWYDMIWYDMIWYDIWYDMICDMILCGMIYGMIWYIWCMIWYMIYVMWCDMIWYDVVWYMIYGMIWYDIYDVRYDTWYDMI